MIPLRLLLAFGLAYLLGPASLAGAQSSPRSPSAPSGPAAPSVPPAPPPATVETGRLASVLLLVDARRGGADRIVLRVEEALLAVATPVPRDGSRDMLPLATLLVDRLGGRGMSPRAGDRIALALGSALTAPGAGELDRALAGVRRSLAEAGLGERDAILIETEVRRARARR